TVYLYQASVGTYAAGSLLDATWPAAIALTSVAVWVPSLPRGRLWDHAAPRFVMPGLAAASALAVLFVGSISPVSRLALGLATAALVGVVARSTLFVNDLRRMAVSRHRDAVTDELTGLGNRRALSQVLETACRRLADGGPPVALLLVDLDRFKEVNDSFGHPVGDDVLRALGPRLQAAMRAGDVLVRIGGDEFAAVLTDADAAYATVVAERLTAAIEQVVDLEVASLHVHASIGIALAPEHATTSTELLRCADVAMYRSKANRLPFDLYEATFDDGRSRVRLLEQLRGAIDDGQLLLHYQPQLDLRTGQLQAVEALVRWQHPELGLVPPAEFLPLAEEAGLMRRLTDFVLDRAVGQATAWRRDGHQVRVSVNLSATNLQDAEIVDRIRFALARHRCRPEALAVEVTESSVMADRMRSEEVLQRLRAVGVRVSIDDFGTGFSS
ncbi:MAG TPA: EAL domain-containing protein, partial [Acidimicrobiales bacterium]|nr:EAL domain-containing protein [Acidimicrobiales bacterium]